ncbi:MAG: carbohydrate kinase family protein [Calditrichaeota bacterium]|nr:MAG: carbohydrate kinase family protein [Calditrichota bacterium]
MKKIAFVGTFIRDEIVPLQGKNKQSIGGLFHGLAAAAFLAQDEFKLFPVANIGRDFEPVLKAALKNLPRVDVRFLTVLPNINTAVTLNYVSETEREETSTALMPPVDPEIIEQLKLFSAVLFNMVSGEDITLNTLKQFRQNSESLIYFDFHTLALARDESGKRFPRRPSNWQEWFKYVDYVQMNENEAAILFGSEIQNNLRKMNEFIHRLFQFGPRGIFITLGSKGVLAGVKSEDDSINLQLISPANLPGQVIDIIGCGDTFGSVFLLQFLRSTNFWESVKKAVHIASLNTTFLGSVTRKNFEEKIQPYA